MGMRTLALLAIGAACAIAGCGSSKNARTDGGAGTSGSAGTTGGAGTTGSAGTTGGAGTTGSAGTSGAAGTTGVAGTTGSAGTTGAGGTGGRPGGVICTYPDSTRCRAALCGNGVRDMCPVSLPADCINTTFTEWCDGADVGGATCASRGLGTGTLRCTSDCGFDTSGCSGAQGGTGGGGTTGSAGTTGAAGSRGGTSGSAGAGGTTGAGGTGGARLCETVQCIRPYVCKASCGGPVVSNNCCPCEPPLFDDFNGQVCGDGGTGSVTYLGCTYVGGADRLVVSKRDTARNLCFNVVLYDSPGTPTAGLTSPQNFRLEWASAGPASACPARFPQLASATQTVGTITQTAGGVGVPQTVDVNVTMSFGAGNDAGAPTAELLSATGIDVRPACQQ
jgi:hypothetical protein